MLESSLFVMKLKYYYKNEFLLEIFEVANSATISCNSGFEVTSRGFFSVTLSSKFQSRAQKA